MAGKIIGPQELLRDAAAALKRADYATAIALAREVTVAELTHAGAFHLLGRALSETGQLKEASCALLQSLALDPTRGTAHATLGQALLSSDSSAAINAYDRATMLAPETAEFHGRHGALLAADNQHEPACSAWSMAISREPDNWSYHYGLGQSLLQLGRADEAIRHFVEAARLNPDRWQVQAQLGAALARIGRDKAALAPLQAAATANPRVAKVQFMLGQVLIRLNRPTEALIPLEAAFRLAPDDAEKQFTLGVAHLRMDRADRALVHLDAAAQRRPDHADTHVLRAHCLAILQRPTESLDAWCRASRIDGATFRWKANFYPLDRLFSALIARDGVTAALSGAIELCMASIPSMPPLDLVRDRPETHAFLTSLVADPSSDLDRGIEFLLQSRPVDALRCYGKHFAEGGPIDAKYDCVVGAGIDAGHSAWHVMNPFFHFWVAARQKKRRPDESWREDPVFAAARGPQALAELYANWHATPNLAREVLRRQVTQLGPAPVRAFDLGCGFGQWLRYLRDECGIKASDLFGCDFHEARVEATRTMLSSTVSPLTGAMASEQFFQADALDWDVESFRARHGSIDLLTMFVVTGCFDDADLNRCLSIAAQLEPRRIIETTVTSSWDLWNGRSNSPDHFARAGYRLIESLRPGDPIATAGPLALVAPRKYWVASQINVYARDRA